jgi:hypothetical protein
MSERQGDGMGGEQAGCDGLRNQMEVEWEMQMATLILWVVVLG